MPSSARLGWAQGARLSARLSVRRGVCVCVCLFATHVDVVPHCVSDEAVGLAGSHVAFHEVVDGAKDIGIAGHDAVVATARDDDEAFVSRACRVVEIIRVPLRHDLVVVPDDDESG